MKLIITREILEQFPGATVGVVIAAGIDNAREHPEIGELLQGEEARVRTELQGAMLTELPQIAAWRQAYRKFGAKPKKHASSIESLLQRILKGQAIPRINNLVDVYNIISLKYTLPAGGEDLEQIDGNILLTTAGHDEVPVRLLGEERERAPRPGEVIYKDRRGALCRRWNWREAERTKLKRWTRNAVLVIEGLPPVAKTTIVQAVSELAELVERYCGGAVETAVLDVEEPDARLS